MKKLLVLLTIILGLGLGACAPSPDITELEAGHRALAERIIELETQIADLENYDDTALYDEYYTLTGDLNTFIAEYEEFDDRDLLIADEDLQALIDELDLDIQALIERLDNLIITTGLNGQTSVYENPISDGQLLLAAVIQLKDTFDKTKAPAYLLDDNEEYVSQEALGILLKEKYFNDITIGIGGNDIDRYSMGSKALFLYLFESEMSNEEVLARTVLMIEELRLYEFYMLSCPELVIDIHRMTNYDNHISITIPLVVVINDFFEITLDGIYDNDYEMRLETYGMEIDYEIAQQYYDDFVTAETFSGYVLNYE